MPGQETALRYRRLAVLSILFSWGKYENPKSIASHRQSSNSKNVFYALINTFSFFFSFGNNSGKKVSKNVFFWNEKHLEWPFYGLLDNWIAV
jgi:hypothetical protein